MKLDTHRWYIVVIVVAVVSFAGGATLSAFFSSSFRTDGTKSTHHPRQTQEVASDAATTIDLNPDASSQNEDTGTIGIDLQGPADLSRLDDLDNEFDHNLVLYLHLSKLDADQLLVLIEESRELGTDIRMNTQRAILQRLVTLDPLAAFVQAENLLPSLMTTVFVQWSRTDVNEAIEYAKVLDQDRKSYALRGILMSRDDLPEDILLQIGKELDNEGLAQSIVNSSKIDKYVKTPGESWREVIGEAQDDPAQIGMLHTLARTWFEEEGLSVIDQINKSITNGYVRNSILGPVLHMAVRNNPQGTFELALGMEDDTMGIRIVESVTRIWASTDPKSALNAVYALESMPLREQLLVSVMQLWANDAPFELLENLESLSEEMLALGLELTIRELAEESPDQAAALLERMEDGLKKREVVHKIAMSWARIEPRVALDWILTDARIAHYRQELLKSVLSGLVVENPQVAFDTALAQPLVDGKLGLEAEVISHLARIDLEMALEMLPRVREGITKLNTYGGVGSMMVLQGRPWEAMDLSEQLAESDHETFFLLTMGAWAQRDPEGLFGTIDRLPSTVAQSKAAAMLTLMNRFEQTLTDDQIDQARKFLSESDAKSLEEGGAGLFNPIMDLSPE